MITTLRQAGFTATSTLADVAKRTGLDVADIKARTGVTTDTLGEKALDQKFIFPDSFAAKGGVSTSADAAQLAGRSDKSSGLGMGNTGAAGLLRMQLNKVDLSVDGNKPKDRGTEGRELKEAILAKVSTLDEAKALAKALGAKPGEIGGHSLLGFSHDLARWMQTRSQNVSNLNDAKPQPYVNTPAVIASVPDATTVPANRLHVAVRDALTKGGIDTKEKVDELARRLGMSEAVRDGPPLYALLSLLDHMNRRGSPEAMAQQVAGAVKQPIAGITPQTVSVDLSKLPSDISKYPHGNAFIGALRKAIIAGGVDTIEHARAFAARLGLGDSITHDVPEHHVFKSINAVFERNGNDAAKTAEELKRALATPLEPLIAPDGLPPFVDASAVKNASSRGALVKAVLSIASSPAQLEELAARLDVINSIASATTMTPAQYAGKIADERSAAQIAAALE